jgi:hypothetical protein
LKGSAKVKTGTFREEFCAKFGCLEEGFAEEVFWRSLYPHAVRPARLLWTRNPAFFKRDFELIALLEDATSCAEMRGEIEAFREHVPPRGLLQGRFRLRISGQRLLKLGAKLLV